MWKIFSVSISSEGVLTSATPTCRRKALEAAPPPAKLAVWLAAALRERWGLAEDQVELSPVVASGDRISGETIRHKPPGTPLDVREEADWAALARD